MRKGENIEHIQL